MAFFVIVLVMTTSICVVAARNGSRDFTWR
jgi:hypothetical protein